MYAVVSDPSQTTYMVPSVIIMSAFFSFCRGPVTVSPWNTGKFRCALTRTLSCMFPFLRWYEFAESCPYLRFVSCCSGNCHWLLKKIWVPYRGLKQEESFLASCTRGRFPFLYYNLVALLKDRASFLSSVIMRLKMRGNIQVKHHPNHQVTA